MLFTTAHRSQSETAVAEEGMINLFFWVNISDDRHMKTKPAQARISTVFSQHRSLGTEPHLGLVGQVCKSNTEEKSPSWRWPPHNLATAGSNFNSIRSTIRLKFQGEHHISQPVLWDKYEKRPPLSASFCLKTFICELSRTVPDAGTLCSPCTSCQTSTSSRDSPSINRDMGGWALSNRRQR